MNDHVERNKQIAIHYNTYLDEHNKFRLSTVNKIHRENLKIL